MSEVISEGSITKALEGHMYNREVRMHKLFYEALMRILLNQIREDVIVKEALQDFDELLDELCCSLDGYSYESVVNSNEYDRVIKIFAEYKLKISTGNLQSFWISYLTMVELLLCLIYAQRTGDWQLHIQCIEKVIPWAFAYDRQNYSRYFTAISV